MDCQGRGTPIRFIHYCETLYPRQGEQKQEQKEEPEDMKGHRILAAGNDEHGELLKGRVSKAEGLVKPFRREGRIIHYRVGQYHRFSQMNTTSKKYLSFLVRTLHASKRKLLHDFALLT
jgi:hypothetical protein